MAHVVVYTYTRPNTDIDFTSPSVEQMDWDNARMASIVDNNIELSYQFGETGLQLIATHTAPDLESWQNHLRVLLQNDGQAVMTDMRERAEADGITIEVTVNGQPVTHSDMLAAVSNL